MTDPDTLYSYAEIATGIIVGCLPILPKFFKHCTTFRSDSLSEFKRLPSTVSHFTWRRFFPRSASRDYSSSNEVASPASSEKRSKDSKSGADRQHITTLNLTRCSLDMTDANLPRAPSRALDGDGSLQDLVGRADYDGDWVYGEVRHGDIEEAAPMADTNRNRLERGREAL